MNIIREIIFMYVNLQENIERIKEVMGIINEDIKLPLRRRLRLLPNYITSTYRWLNPKAFSNFEEFLGRVAFSATRDFVADITINKNIYEYEQQVEEIAPIVKKMIQDDFMKEIEDYFITERDK